MTEATVQTLTEDRVREALRQVIDPEIGLNVVDLGLVYGIAIDGATVRVQMTMTSPACPLGRQICDSAHDAIVRAGAGADRVEVDLVWEPPWTPEMMSEDAKRRFGW